MPKKGGLFLTFKTPYNSVKRSQIKDVNNPLDTLFEDLALQSVGLIARQARTAAEVMKNRNFNVVATFFQRVCARTPLDEPYETEELRNIKGHLVKVKVKHETDLQRVRMDWYILDSRTGNKILTAGQIANQKEDVFDKYNDKESIEFIKNILSEHFSRQNASEMKFRIGNDNPYFAVLEYGGYKVTRSTIKKGDGNKYEHGIENSRSVQAPMGMFRITEMELDSIIDSSAKTNLSTRYKRQSTNKIPSKARLKQLMKKLEYTTYFDLKDLMKIIGE